MEENKERWGNMSTKNQTNMLNNTIFIDVEYKQYTFITIKPGFSSSKKLQ